MVYAAESTTAKVLLESELSKLETVISHADRETHKELVKALSLVRTARYRLEQKANPNWSSTEALEAEYTL